MSFCFCSSSLPLVTSSFSVTLSVSLFLFVFLSLSFYLSLSLFPPLSFSPSFSLFRCSFPQGRDNVILLGDHMGDHMMANGLTTIENIVKVGYLNHEV